MVAIYTTGMLMFNHLNPSKYPTNIAWHYLAMMIAHILN